MSNVFSEFRSQQLRRYYDIVRSPFSADFDWKRMIRESELSDEVQETIHAVISKSRLLRIEKTHVTEELISHFHEGHKRGKTSNFLLVKFGDPDVAATLIRSSKIRNRSMFSRIFYGGFFLSLIHI